MSGEDTALERLRAALDELADSEAGSLLAEARIEARARVRGVLAEAIAERLLDSAEREIAGLGEQQPSAPAEVRARRPATAVRMRDGSPGSRSRSDDEPAAVPQPAAATDDGPPGGEQGWYVYGIVEQGFEPEAGAGVDDAHALEVVAAAGLGALVSRVPLAEFGEEPLRARLEDLPWLERNARRHEQILERVREQRVTVVPMRLFTIYESTASLVAMLTRERRYLAEALGRLACRTEWGVKLYVLPDAAALEHLLASEQDAPDEHVGPGESYLLRRRSADRRREDAARRLDDVRDRAHDRLAGLAVEARVNPLQPPELSDHEGTMLMNGVYLVDDDSLQAFRDAVSDLGTEGAEQGIDVVLTGPWPPYNFVNSSQEAQV
jgi:hypothetical protein